MALKRADFFTLDDSSALFEIAEYIFFISSCFIARDVATTNLNDMYKQENIYWIWGIVLIAFGLGWFIFGIAWGIIIGAGSLILMHFYDSLTGKR